jgi:hypothetical protein
VAIELTSLLPVAKSALGSWVVKKGTDALWAQLGKYFPPDALRATIELVLKSDPRIAAICRPPPTFNRSRFNQEHVDTLLRSVLSDDAQALGNYLVTEQLIDLPPFPAKLPDSFGPVWECIAEAIIQGIRGAIQQDERLARGYQAAAAQLGHVQQQQTLVATTGIQATLSEIQSSLAMLPENIDTIVRERVNPYPEGAAMSRALSLAIADNERLGSNFENNLILRLNACGMRCWQKSNGTTSQRRCKKLARFTTGLLRGEISFQMWRGDAPNFISRRSQ